MLLSLPLLSHVADSLSPVWMSRLEMMSLADSVLKKEDKLHDGEQVVLMCCSPEESGLGGKIDSIFVHIVGNEV